MSIKLIALGNSLMKDDGVGIEVAKQIQEFLIGKGIEIIWGETDFQYCISKLREGDFIFVLDAAYFDKSPGEVTIIKLSDYDSNKNIVSQHSYSLLDLLKLYVPNIQGLVFAIEIKEIDFNFGLSIELSEKINDICLEIRQEMEKTIEAINNQ